jgi:YD repeat-containing protein
MLRPGQIDPILTTARARVRAMASSAQRTIRAERAAVGPMAGPSISGPRRTQSLPSDPAAPGTGINPWWRYQEQNVPGGGHVMVNVGTGNLVLQDDDMAVAHKGIAMAFRRTYNSQSGHDVNATDAAGYVFEPPGMYGNGWTSTFDAHIARNAALTLYSVFDIDGARYDYDATWPTGTNGVFAPRAGNHATLAYDGVCGYLWTKKSGTTYYFYAPGPHAPCPQLGGSTEGYTGRLYQIVGRNRNTYLTFDYSWDGGVASLTGKISQITVQSESGMTATLYFADFNGHRLLQQLKFPDNATTVTYAYDQLGNLSTVSRPPNNAGGVRPLQAFGYQAIGNDSILQFASSPRMQSACGTQAGCSSDGGSLVFGFSGASAATSAVSSIQDYANVNLAIADGSTATTLQGAQYPTTVYAYNTEYYTTGGSTPTFRDTAGHMTNWVVDGMGRPTQTQECPASANQGQLCTGTPLTSNEVWDADNNLVSEIDARGYESDYVYDIDGNTVAAAAPAPADGATRSTRLFTYDGHDNVTAYCDANATHSLGADWTSAPSAPIPGQGGLCPNSTVAVQAQWLSTSAEPFGELSAMISPATAAAPLGYQRTISYDIAQQGGSDFGLPTRVTGASITQTGDSTTPTRRPQQSFWYDGNGNLVCYGTGSGQWLLTYDSLNRLTAAADPDDSSSGSGSCGKSGAQPGWNTTSHTTYFPDGSVASKQSASQAAASISTAFTYDLDGNEKTEMHHHGCLSVASCTAGVTTKWYDGADRLVEVQQPYDGSDVQSYPWSTRYIYDLSQGGSASYRGMGLAGYGNLVSTQELLSGTIFAPVGTYSIASGTWTDVRATSYDALDRPISSYEAAFGDQAKVTNTYDGAGEMGLLSSVHLATSELKGLTYDHMGRQTDVSYAYDGGVTPQIHEIYDPAGNVVSRATAALGAETLTYDATGAVTSVKQPAAVGGGTITYAYYADGLRANAGYADGTQSYSDVLSYGYRADGKRDRLAVGNTAVFSWTYTAAGRTQTQTDPLTGAMVHPSATYQANKFYKPYYPATVTYAPWTQSFDSYGRVATITLPVSLFAYTASHFDLEDGVADHTASAYVPVPNPASYTSSQFTCLQSTIRDEKRNLTLGAPSSCSNAIGPVQINGAQLVQSPYRAQALPGWTLDARGGMLMHNTAALGTDTIGSSYAYDASGRLNQDFEGASEIVTNSPPTDPTFTSNWCPVGFVGTPGYTSFRCYSNGSRSKTYDTENRIRTETFSYQPEFSSTSGPTYSTTSYGFAEYGSYWQDTSGYQQPANIQAVDYSATSHPMRFALYHPDLAGNPNVPASESRGWLWDGNDRFIECQLINGTCTSPTLSVEGLGDYDLGRGTFIRINDRNRNGQVAMSRDATGFSGWSDFPARMAHVVYAPCSTGNADLPAAQAGICAKQHDGKLTADGWSLDYETWQGVRTFDPAVGQWNTPDAYAGEAHDPMSQKPFMWNRNDPYQYSDPSGLVPLWDEAWDMQWASSHDVQASDIEVNVILHVRYTGFRDPALEESYNRAIQDDWSGRVGKYIVSVKVDQVEADYKGASDEIHIDPSSDRAIVENWNTMRVGVMPPWTAAHEAGHLMHIPDAYNRITGKPYKGFEHNIMGAWGELGKTEQQIMYIIRFGRRTAYGYEFP